MRFYFHISAVLTGMILMLSIPLWAHHSISGFWDEASTIEVNGVVKRLRVVNPHAEIVVTVTNASGQKEDWIGVAGMASQMIKAGWNNDILKVGTEVRLEGAAPRQKGAKGILVRKITLPDGRVLTSGRID